MEQTATAEIYPISTISGTIKHRYVSVQIFPSKKTEHSLVGKLGLVSFPPSNPEIKPVPLQTAYQKIQKKYSNGSQLTDQIHGNLEHFNML